MMLQLQFNDRVALSSCNRQDYLRNYFNYHLDQWVMLPAVRGYRYVTPRIVRTGVSNF